MNHTAASAAFLVVLLSACGKAPPQSAASAARRAAFKDYLPLTAQMRKTANGDSPYRPEEFERLAAEFAREAPRPFQYFQNDPQGNGRARAEIWQQPERFQKRRDDFYAAVAELDAAAQSRAPRPHPRCLRAYGTQLPGLLRRLPQSLGLLTISLAAVFLAKKHPPAASKMPASVQSWRAFFLASGHFLLKKPSRKPNVNNP